MMLSETGGLLPGSRVLGAGWHMRGVDKLKKTKGLGAGPLTLSSQGPSLHQLAASWYSLTSKSEGFVFLSYDFLCLLSLWRNPGHGMQAFSPPLVPPLRKKKKCWSKGKYFNTL